MGSIEQDAVQEIVKLPIINLSHPSAEVGKQMVAAAIEYGFLYIDPVGTTFTEAMVNREFELSKQFFSSPASEKSLCQIKDNRGWTGMHHEILDPQNQRKGDFKEAFNIAEFADGSPQQPMPPCFKGLEGELQGFERACRTTCNQILDLIAVGLDVNDTQFFSSRHTQPSGSTVRMLHYPAVPADVDYRPEVDIRAGAHSDYGSVTLLFQRPSQPGLEIQTKQNSWAPVPVFPSGYEQHSTTFPPILVNIGDLMSYWTNMLLKSTIHRVIFPKDARKGGEDRYSIAYFCHPANETELVPIPSETVQAQKLDEGVQVGYGGGASSKRPLTAKEHLLSRLEKTYGPIPAT